MLSLQQTVEATSLKSLWPQIEHFIISDHNHDAASISLESIKAAFEGEAFKHLLGSNERQSSF
jgi:hypothetical protein